jgi:hypothetical protein
MPEMPLPKAAYGPDTSRSVYDTIRKKANVALKAGYTVIIDSVALLEEERRSFVAVAADAKVPFTGIWLDAPAKAMAARLLARRNDASDATSEVLQAQLHHEPGHIDWLRINAGGDQIQSFASVRQAVESVRTPQA